MDKKEAMENLDRTPTCNFVRHIRTVNKLKIRQLCQLVHELNSYRVAMDANRAVVNNLLLNSLKFTETREAAVIEAGSTVINKETVYYIKDNGIGFDMKLADKLFEPFSKLNSSDDFEQPGIGLAIARRLTIINGGNIWARSNKGRGATFYFTLPGS